MKILKSNALPGWTTLSDALPRAERAVWWACGKIEAERLKQPLSTRVAGDGSADPLTMFWTATSVNERRGPARSIALPRSSSSASRRLAVVSEPRSASTSESRLRLCHRLDTGLVVVAGFPENFSPQGQTSVRLGRPRRTPSASFQDADLCIVNRGGTTENVRT